MNGGIYGILDSKTRQIVYVGKSSNLETRFVAHKQKWKEATNMALEHGVIPSPINQSFMTTFAYLSLDGRKLELIVLELTDSAEKMEVAENTWADILVDAGHPLSNGNIKALSIGSKYKSQVQQAYQIEGEEVRSNKFNRLEHPSVWNTKKEEYGIWAKGQCILKIPTIAMLWKDFPDIYTKVIRGEMPSYNAILKSKSKA